jgi:hypothetical protein
LEQDEIGSKELFGVEFVPRLLLMQKVQVLMRAFSSETRRHAHHHPTSVHVLSVQPSKSTTPGHNN